MYLRSIFCSAVLIVFLFSCGEVQPESEKQPALFEIKKYDGKKYRPEQPIKFSHKTHTTGFSNLDCKQCHSNYFPEDSIKLKSITKNPINNIEVKKIPFKHPKGLGDISDCARCHY